MSLTSYRAAPPRVICFRPGHARLVVSCSGPLGPDGAALPRVRENSWIRRTGEMISRFDRRHGESRVLASRAALGRPGSVLLSRALRRSTIGAEGFHGRVRNGIGCRPLAMTTRSPKRSARILLATAHAVLESFCTFVKLATIGRPENDVSEPARAVLSKPFERLGPVSYTRYRASTPGLSTWWSSTALKGGLILRGASRLDAFSGYPVRT